MMMSAEPATAQVLFVLRKTGDNGGWVHELEQRSAAAGGELEPSFSSHCVGGLLAPARGGLRGRPTTKTPSAFPIAAPARAARKDAGGPTPSLAS